MNKNQADIILKGLHESWAWGTPGSEYPNSRCLGMVISDRIDAGHVPQVIADVERQIRQLFPERAGVTLNPLPMFNCCNSAVIPAFNNHPDTSLADIRKVIEAY